MMILISGLPGSGKTYFAKALSDELNAVHLSSDKIRKQSAQQGNYGQSAKQRVYDEMEQQMLHELKQGHTVILDATFYKNNLRTRFLQAARKITDKTCVILMEADEQEIKKRISKKRKDSEADFSIYLQLKQEFEFPEEKHLVLHSDQMSIQEMIKKAIKYLQE